MIDLSNSIEPDTVNGALLLSVFDFITCFFVLYFISFFIKGITFIDEKLEKRNKNQSKTDEDKSTEV
jgi:hypothetical protein